MSSNLTRNILSPRSILIATFVLCAVAIGSYIYFFSKNAIDRTPTGFGQLGDYVGGVVGTIVATGTVFFLVLTLNSQTKTKNDNFFFYLLQLKEKHLDSLNGLILGQPYNGKLFLRGLVTECRLIHYHYSGNSEKVKAILLRVKPGLISYLNHNREIINFLSSTSNDIAKYHSVDYKNIYLAQLSNEEKIILGYFCALLPDNVALLKKFYVENEIGQLIEYERHLAESRTQRPDAITEILELLEQ